MITWKALEYEISIKKSLILGQSSKITKETDLFSYDPTR